MAHNPAAGSARPTIDSMEDFWHTRKFERSYGVLTTQNDAQLMRSFDRLQHRSYNYFLFNCEYFINGMLGYFHFQRGKILFALSSLAVIVLLVMVVSKLKTGKP